MATEIYCRVGRYGLVPLYESDRDALAAFKKDSEVKVSLTNPRNYRFHKKFFALVRLTLDNMPEEVADRYDIRTEADLVRRFKHDLGKYRTRMNCDGEREVEYDSISFAAMDETAFNRFYNDCVNLVLQRYLPGAAKDDIMDNLLNFM